MGKLIISQRRGKGSPAYKSPSHNYKTKLTYRSYDDIQKSSVLKCDVIDFVLDPARTAPLAMVLYEDGIYDYILPAEGVGTGQRIEMGVGADIKVGNVLPLANIRDGMPIFNIERRPGDGGQLVKAGGSWAVITGRDAKGIYVRLPSRKKIIFNPACRATIGCAAGGGQGEKPIVKAGKNSYITRANNKNWPKVRGVAMNPVNHPHGGGEHHVGKATTRSRHARPGQKVGHIAASRTGRRKK
ncbi:MAG: 50S ribosomal protein L2 [Candidatus Diapherotrites archaeon]|nr:50S ribosomal protein L2 [Candidatus Diapherotrites archaeon]